MSSKQRAQAKNRVLITAPVDQCRDRRAHLGGAFRRRARRHLRLQEQIAANVSARCRRSLAREIERAQRRATANPSAHDCYLRASRTCI